MANSTPGSSNDNDESGESRCAPQPGYGSLSEELAKLQRSEEEERSTERERTLHPGSATDAAWKLAEDYGLCVGFIEGSGRRGRVLKSDVQETIERLRERLGADDE